jgi:hypothetical protein
MKAFFLKTLSGLLFLISMSVGELYANVFYTFSENSVGVQVSYSGSLDTSLLTPQGGLSHGLTYVEIAPSGFTVINISNFQPSPLMPELPSVGLQFSADGVTFSIDPSAILNRQYASSASGDTFSFLVFDYVGSYRSVLCVPWAYVSSTEFSGDMFFQGATFSSLGIRPDQGFQINLPGGQTISGIVVPEPASMTLLLGGFSLFALLGTRR